MMKTLFIQTEKLYKENLAKWQEFMTESITPEDNQITVDFIDKIDQFRNSLKFQSDNTELLEKINRIYADRYTKYNTLQNIMEKRNQLPRQVRLILSDIFYDHIKSLKYSLPLCLEKEDDKIKQQLKQLHKYEWLSTLIDTR